jgi:Na+/proline symporter
MSLFLTSAPLWVLFLLLLLFTALAMAGPPLIRRRVPLEKLRTNNEVAGFMFATIGVLYAVLLAFVVIIVWERFHEAEKALAAEAGHAAAIYRLSVGLNEAPAAAVRGGIAGYLKSVLQDEWPAMAAGHPSPATTRALTALYTELARYRPTDVNDQHLRDDLLHEVEQLTQSRRERLVMAEGTVPDMVWFALFIGALLTIAYTFFFGTQNVIAQSVMTGVLAALIFSGILVVIALDRPFTGAVEVSKESIRTVLEETQTAP